MIHLTLILVDFLTGLIVAGAWALLAAGIVIVAIVIAAYAGISSFQRWRNRR
ncbi:hypothetical protein BH10PSE12_BH10PSE12_36370 [soil metagenome]